MNDNSHNALPLEWDDSASVHTGSEHLSTNGSLLSGNAISPSPGDSPIMESVDMSKLELDNAELTTENGTLPLSENTSSAIGNSHAGQNGSVKNGETIAIVDPCDVPRSTSPHLNSSGQLSSAFTVGRMADDCAGGSDSPRSQTEISLDSPEHNHKKPLLKEKLHLDLAASAGSTVRDDSIQSPSYVQSPMRRFKEVPIMRNSYMSPLIATDELLKGLPPVHIIVSTLRLLSYRHENLPFFVSQIWQFHSFSACFEGIWQFSFFFYTEIHSHA